MIDAPFLQFLISALEFLALVTLGSFLGIRAFDLFLRLR